MADIERLTLSTLKAGDSVTTTAGQVPDAYRYKFTVIEPGEMPLCDLMQTDPSGAVVGPAKAILQGSGRWTTEQQNPMQRADWLVGRQRQKIALSIGYGLLSTGDYVIISEPGNTTGNRLQLQPECTAISIDQVG